MAATYLSQMSTPAVAAAQKQYYGREREVPALDTADPLGADEIEFIAGRDSFYLASINEHGWPYVQHRGGPTGFLRVLDPLSLEFPDMRGNRQLLTVGNVEKNDRVSLFLMDYPNRTRLKILGRMRVIDARDEPERAAELGAMMQGGTVERISRIAVVSFDWNCAQWITPRFTEEEVAEAVAPLKARLADLEQRLSSSGR
jgi:predicted pyridoxine 5'-phosphate oxidase superfamily flavin-nucleotide-binding protein